MRCEVVPFFFLHLRCPFTDLICFALQKEKKKKKLICGGIEALLERDKVVLLLWVVLVWFHVRCSRF